MGLFKLAESGEGIRSTFSDRSHKRKRIPAAAAIRLGTDAGANYSASAVVMFFAVQDRYYTSASLTVVATSVQV